MTRRLPLSRILNGLYGEAVLAVITRPEKLSQVTLPNDFVMKVQFVTLKNRARWAYATSRAVLGFPSNHAARRQ
jgi:hypothetical protein